LDRPSATWLSTRDELDAWLVGCPCGEDKGMLFGVREQDKYCDPIFYACAACNRRALIFDSKLHGYNAEVDRLRKRRRRATKGRDATFAMYCRACKTTAWRPAVLVTYQGDRDNYEGYEGKLFDPFADFFDVILIGGACVRCGNIAFGYHNECA